MFLQTTNKLKYNIFYVDITFLYVQSSVLHGNTGLKIWLGLVKLHIGLLGSVAQIWLEMILMSVLEVGAPQ